VSDVPGMVQAATRLAREEIAMAPGAFIAIAAGMPFGQAGSTNLLHIAQI
jgi:pyruvate kinase